ncbi:glycosyltransferase family 4 protein [Photobacterium damselae]|uniref:glycosyltransferase family 4 protein n=1 Tax=Photobacterium damselae TaxID=38293 RepID=UPI0010FD3800|nr:glycosyltransferase family 4 protein [Photobacterium damselae]TLS69319.1 glycosyltransferase [Photobacterium damselae subsp. damselae]
MKILIVNTSDIDGGASRAAYRLHKSLQKNNIDSQMLVLSKSSDDFTVHSFNNKADKLFSKLRPALDSIPIRMYNNKTLFSPSYIPSISIINKINELNPDIVHLHWINAGMIKIEDLVKIRAPIVWSLHDMWPFTGGCHYDENCGGFTKECGSCIVLASNKNNDISHKVLMRKKRTYSNIPNMTIVGLSKWLEKCAKDSVLLRDKSIVNLPNPIDIDVFKAFDKYKSRELWNLPKNKKLVLFGAMGATSDPRKGFTELCEALKHLERDDMEFVVFGASAPSTPININCKINYIGRLSDDISLVTLYSAVDVMIVPSKQENLSNAIMESLACSTPVIGFDIGGNSDLIEHKKNGYLAKAFDSIDLANGIEWILDNNDYHELCLNAVDKVTREFNSEIVVQKYINLYKGIVNE